MRIAFLEDVLRFSVPLGITGVAAMLRRGGHEVGLFLAERDLDRTLRRVAAFRPDAVAFSVLSGSHLNSFAIARRVKERLGVPTLWGGPHPTFFPEMIELPWVDAVCVGEGEEAALLLADGFDREGGRLPTAIPNFLVKRDGQVHANPLLPRNRSLDDLPFPARDLYFDQFPILRNHGIKHFMAHRGCPYRCTYCFNDGYNALYREQAGDRAIFRSRSPESVVDEVLWTRERVPLRMAAFVDDVFTLQKRWTLEFAEVYARRCRIPFSINARFDNVDEEIVAALRGAGLHLVYAGVESGDEFIRNRVMLRGMSEERMLAAATLFRRHEVKLITENVLGAPGETYRTARSTLSVNAKIRPSLANASLFMPYPRLALTRYAVDNGYFDGGVDNLGGNYYHQSALRFESEREARRILNLRHFFSFLAHHPRLLPVVEPLLGIRENALIRWFGDLADGYYLKRCLPYRMTVLDFLRTLRHFLLFYRRVPTAGRPDRQTATGKN